MIKVEGMPRFPLREAKLRVGIYLNRMNDHLVKLIMWGNDKTTQHWLNEIFIFLRDSKSIRVSLPSRDRLTKKEFLNEISTIDDWDNFKSSYLDNETLIKNQETNFDLKWMHQEWSKISPLIKSFYDKISDELSAKGEFSKTILMGHINILINHIRVLYEIHLREISEI
jgi:hypothetical protein